MRKRLQQKVQDTIAVLKQHSPTNPIDEAIQKRESYTFWANIAVFLFPTILTTYFGLIAFGVFSLNTIKFWIVLGFAILAVVLSVIFLMQQHLYQLVIDELAKDDSNNRNNIARLEKKIKNLEIDNHMLLSTFIELLKFRNNTTREMSVVDRASIIAGSIFFNCQTKYGIASGFEINIYEFQNEHIRLIGTYTHTPTNTTHRLISTTPCSIKDPRIKQYYCVKRIKSDNTIDCLPSWYDILKAFHWSHWQPGQRTAIIRSKSRDACLSVGFNYNQYIAFRIKREDGITALVEITTYDDIALSEPKQLALVAQKLYKSYMPLINAIWELA